MNIEVVPVNGIPMVSSKNIADKFDKQHRDVLVKIRSIIKKSGDFGERNFSLSSYLSDQNKELPCYNMTRDGFTMLAMELSGSKVFQWKLKYIEAFNAMESQLLKQNDSLEWKQARLQGKQARRSFTDVVKEFVEYATDQGSKSASMYYMNITKMEYAALELTEKGQKLPKDFRETLDCMDLCFLATAEQIAKNAIKNGIDSKMHYKEIYKLAKDRVFAYAETVKLPRLN
ncbi:transcriptional regulator [Vibrio phage PVA1]|uniref:transcriptional regulator n=1 Tax=Vibrio phage PVA1 TaxID=1461743 RepID=UPI0003F1DEAB|nr:transcriptional regulator [Vibrio phage PVA1]AHJ87863.1 Rha family phage regulatory protein [Vibrio phage PVA1]